jgi:hypothetical protein
MVPFDAPPGGDDSESDPEASDEYDSLDSDGYYDADSDASEWSDSELENVVLLEKGMVSSATRKGTSPSEFNV